MPIFEYQCQDCGAMFERILTSSTAEVTCKNCDSSRVEKLLSVFAVSSPSGSTAMSETGPCGACGAPRRGICGE